MKTPPPAVEKVWTPSQLRWLSHELESPTCHSPYVEEDLGNYLSGQMPPVQATSFKRHLGRNAGLKAFVDECQAGVPESVERVMQKIRALTLPHPAKPELAPRLKLLDPPAKVMVIAGKVVGGVWSLEELPAAACSTKSSYLVKDVEVRFPDVSKGVRLGVYLSLSEQKSANPHRFTVSLPRRMDASDLARLKNWRFFCGPLEISLKTCRGACDAATMKDVLASSDMVFTPATP